MPFHTAHAMQMVATLCRPSQKLHYGPEFPLKIVRGQGQYFFDENDVRYLDTTNNVAHGELLCKLAVIH